MDGDYIRRICHNGFSGDVECLDCWFKLRMIALVKKEMSIQELARVMHLLKVFHSLGPPEGVIPEPAETKALKFEWKGYL